LKQDECCFFADPSGGLVAFGNEAVHLRLHSEECLLNAGGFHENVDPLAMDSLNLQIRLSKSSTFAASSLIPHAFVEYRANFAMAARAACSFWAYSRSNTPSPPPRLAAIAMDGSVKPGGDTAIN
jgi:hypothetical protein